MQAKPLIALVGIAGLVAIFLNWPSTFEDSLSANTKIRNAFAKDAYVKFAKYGSENPDYIKLYQSQPVSALKNLKFKLTPDDMQNENHLLQHFNGRFNLVIVCDGRAQIPLADLNSHWSTSEDVYFDPPLQCGENVSASENVIHTVVNSWKMQIEIEVKGNYDYFSYAIFKTP